MGTSSAVALAPLEKLVFASQLPMLQTTDEELIKSRQKELEELVNSPYVDVIYDHNRSLAKEAVKKDPDRIAKEKLIDRAYIATDLPYGAFGKPVKTKLHVFREFFEQAKIEISPHVVVAKPTLARKKSQMEHELVHAADYFNGFTLENGIKINTNNFYRLHPDVRDFVLETRAYIRQIEVARAMEKPNTKNFSYTSMHRLPDGYLTAMTSFIEYLSIALPKVVNTRGFSEFEQSCVRNQLDQINKRANEVVRLIYSK